MTLKAAIAQWLETTARDDSVVQADAESRALSLILLARYFGEGRRIEELTPALLRDFLARWYIENAGPASRRTSDDSLSEWHPDPITLIDALTAFIGWAARHAALAAEAYLAVLTELRDRLPRAIAIGARLSEQIAHRGGAFGFPEFLTSFEAGGHSQYDVDAVGDVGCLEGYFRITHTAGGHVEAEEMLTETVISPILFPEDVAALLDRDYVINLELIHAEDGWHIAACGFAYPPGTEV